MHSEADGTSVLAGLPLLAGLPAGVRELVERSFTTVELGFGEVLFRKGESPDAYYVVAAGSARVLGEGGDGEEVSLNVLRAGDAFGETALLEGTPRTATIRASSPLRLLAARPRRIPGDHRELPAGRGRAPRHREGPADQ